MEINSTQTRQYLVDNHRICVSSSTIIKWMRNGHLDGWQDVSRRWYTTTEVIERAILDKKIPPRVGMQRKYTDEQKNRMKRLRMEGYKLREIAEKYGCDESYVSYVYRGLR